MCRYRTALEEVLVDTYEAARVAGRYVLDLLLKASHHNERTLDILHPEITLLARDVVGAHDANLLTCRDLPRKHAAEGKEPTPIRGRDHLGDVHHERCTIGRVTSTDCVGTCVVERPIVQVLDAIALRRCWRG